MRWTFFIGYCLLLLIGTVVIAKRADQRGTSLVATQDMPANWLLQVGDVSPVSDQRRYTQRAIKKNEAIAPHDTVELPAMQPPSGSILLLQQVDSALIAHGDVNAGKVVRICRGNSVLLEKVSVHSVMCSADGKSCNALLAVTADAVAKLAAPSGTAAASPTLQLPGKPCA